MQGIERVGVVGAGALGTAVAGACVRADRDVLLVDRSRSAAEHGRMRLLDRLDRDVRTGRLSDAERERAAWRLRVTTDPGELTDRELVVEAVTEDASVKRDVLGTVSGVVKTDDALIATTTSSLPVTLLAGATDRPGAVVGLHFLPPAPVLPLVEIVPALGTEPRTVDRAELFVTHTLRRRTLRVPDRAGFVVHTLIVPYLLAAIRLVEAGTATAEDVDAAMRVGCAHPTGPLELADLIGLDTLARVADSMHAEHCEPQFVTPALLRRMVEAGRHGRRSGRGFHSYPSKAYPLPYEEIA
ncbi:3-hydroxybutyryl-CoA dehydrogenase, 3-hydroxyacyl-CoA dehydrogenase [Pseudonocardia sp. Ae168_Ps1]|uniref:3-hydroxybutyryl-CoA dehydrogenase n=1 Tax=unclassified Pseudonocardia TaxID=2619320 RepID=UPI00094AFAAA|nr:MULTISPECIES: 3-hydroxybutyryl-CoA dehydrogenase [unclassified Pseudonocardia]OLL74450.1 3-hydroxybutyryl-CoA dehydrogenase [Pseudonocardia sp. Ae150A_Ps1]OLL80430.1 3-hydroxybutyryl-CoA dehydrogenase, 3-hydroxyacyl-CoA dehydrogenase [Pseudonocardia sp. Ae168_Ps1]OLL85443.1 3-hydroxybutyryl-CoA dehydrogenase, 3-hydroxyacyl-CoA dehydrogenase [Pseudonocardia sp. Ae263_Ps1]OLL94530.1 3-hydroxybutyryl-CoA dehydrogenase, 3-hydroxyacyl-CoA dehydrogenase [Pseudonocardia sp. Ae356_Ps1]